MRRVAPFIIVVAFAVFAIAYAGRDASNARAESARLRVTLDSLTPLIGRVDTTYRTDTVRLWRTLTHYDSVRTTDTLTRNDTVFVPRIVADEAVAACRAVVVTCEERVRLRDQKLAVLDSLNANTERRLTASERKARRDRIVWGLGGALAGWALKP